MRAVMPEYFCNLDANMLRLDYLQRPELSKGTVDFAVPEEYWAPHPPPSIRPLYHSMLPEPTTSRRIPAPMDYVFAFDVSQEAVRSGFLQTACNVLIELLYGRDDTIPPCFPPSSHIAILAFDRTLQFYNLSVRLSLCLPPKPRITNLLLDRCRWTAADAGGSRRRRRVFTRKFGLVCQPC